MNGMAKEMTDALHRQNEFNGKVILNDLDFERNELIADIQNIINKLYYYSHTIKITEEERDKMFRVTSLLVEIKDDIKNKELEVIKNG